MFRERKEKLTRPTLELNVTTLAGTSMTLRVSSLDTVRDVKSQIQQHEGIPASQQHLVWNAGVLKDDDQLRDCHLYSGATLQLVLNMRGGPVNVRRVPSEEPTLQDFADYLSETSRNDVVSASSTSRRPVTVVVCQNGDQLKFYQLVSAGNISPSVTCSHSSSSEADPDDVEEEVLSPKMVHFEENQKTRDKMKSVRSQMERCSLLKEKPKTTMMTPLVPRPPSNGCPVRSKRLLRLPATIVDSAVSTVDDLNEKSFQSKTSTVAQSDSLMQTGKTVNNAVLGSSSVQLDICDGKLNHSVAELDTADNLPKLTPAEPESEKFQEDLATEPESSISYDSGSTPYSDNTVKLQQTDSSPATDSQNCKPPVASVNKYSNQSLDSEFSQLTKSTASVKASSNVQSHDLEEEYRKVRRKFSAAVSAGRDHSSSTTRLSRGQSERGLLLRSLSSRETKTMSGLISSFCSRRRDQSTAGSSSNATVLRESYKISDIQSRSRSSLFTTKQPSFESKLISSSKDASCELPSLTTSLPTASVPKRCTICRKKTGIAGSFLCRCGGNYCGLHRYAESHGCTFDYRAEGRRVVAQNNPLVAAEKLPKI